MKFIWREKDQMLYKMFFSVARLKKLVQIDVFVVVVVVVIKKKEKKLTVREAISGLT